MTATSTTAIEQQQVEAFAGRVVGDIAATMSTIFVALGDKLGLFSALASGGPATPTELAQRTATDERYVREWLHGLNANGVSRTGPADGTLLAARRPRGSAGR